MVFFFKKKKEKKSNWERVGSKQQKKNLKGNLNLESLNSGAQAIVVHVKHKLIIIAIFYFVEHQV